MIINYNYFYSSVIPIFHSLFILCILYNLKYKIKLKRKLKYSVLEIHRGKPGIT